jgi:hypothetical protein
MCKKNKQKDEGQVSMENGKARYGGYYLAVGELGPDFDKIRAGGLEH